MFKKFKFQMSIGNIICLIHNIMETTAVDNIFPPNENVV